MQDYSKVAGVEPLTRFWLIARTESGGFHLILAQMPLAGLAASGPAKSKAGASVDARNALAAEPASGINFGARIRSKPYQAVHVRSKPG